MIWYTDPAWWVSAVAATATTLAVVVALFGDVARRKWFPPKLALSLLAPAGELTTVGLQHPVNALAGPRPESARYYHLVLSNKRGWSTAHNAAVYVTRIDLPGAGGEYFMAWNGEAPLSWRHGEIYSLLRPVGVTDLYCDLVSLVRNKWLELLLVIRPNHVPSDCETPGRWRGPISFIVYVQAKAIEAQSKIMRFSISWDGGWAEGDAEIGRHLSIRRLAEAEPEN